MMVLTENNNGYILNLLDGNSWIVYNYRIDVVEVM